MAFDVKKALIYSHIAYSFPAAVFVVSAIGYILDKVLKTSYLFTFIGFVTGIFIGIFDVIRTLSKDQDKRE
jgi:F0F1-type ATP synthase assembly protein I